MPIDAWQRDQWGNYEPANCLRDYPQKRPVVSVITNAYITEDGLNFYTTEDGLNIYIPEG